MSEETKQADACNTAPLPLDAWIDKHADELRGELVCHLQNVTGCSPREIEDAIRMSFISIRQWAGEIEHLKDCDSLLGKTAKEGSDLRIENKRLREALTSLCPPTRGDG